MILSLVLLALLRPADDPDSDGDGLSDFQEIHKYRTDPTRADSDLDGVADGDWNERREFSYSIRTVLRVLPPVNTAALNDDYQDALVLHEDPAYVELEVIHYPLNTCAEAIVPATGWQRPAAALRPYLEPGVTTNWDAALQRQLRSDLRAAGIDLDELTDAEAAVQVAKFALEHARSLETFTTYLACYPEGRPAILPGLEEKFERKKYRPDWSAEDQFEHEHLGREMYQHRTRGTCTSSATYLTTVLRAAGIPTRMLIAVPLIDASDEKQWTLVEQGIRHPPVRDEILRGLEPLRGAYAAHTFNEVYVGGRWRRLNSTRLGQNILDAGCFGLLTKVNQFRDLAETELAPTWGHPDFGPGRAQFVHSNPYSAVSVSDRTGVHCDLPEPPRQRSTEHAHAHITRACWFHSPERPERIGEGEVPRDDAGHVLLHAADWQDGVGISQYSRFYAEVDKQFTLEARGLPTLTAEARRGFWGPEFYLQIPPDQYARMQEGIPYRLVARNASEEHQWQIDPGVELTKQPQKPRALALPTLTLVKLRRSDDPELPDWLRESMPEDPGSVWLLAHVKEWLPEGGSDAIKEFTCHADLDFDFQARGHEAVRARAGVGCATSDDGTVREVLLRIAPADAARIDRGVRYTLVPRNDAPVRWKVSLPGKFRLDG